MSSESHSVTFFAQLLSLMVSLLNFTFLSSMSSASESGCLSISRTSPRLTIPHSMRSFIRGSFCLFPAFPPPRPAGRTAPAAAIGARKSSRLSGGRTRFTSRNNWSRNVFGANRKAEISTPLLISHATAESVRSSKSEATRKMRCFLLNVPRESLSRRNPTRRSWRTPGR